MCTIVRKFSFVSYLTCLVIHRVASCFLESCRLPLERKSNKNETIILRLRLYPLDVAGRFRCCSLASYDLVLRVKYPLERVAEGFLANGRLVLVAGANHARPPRVLTSLQLAREKERRGEREKGKKTEVARLHWFSRCLFLSSVSSWFFSVWSVSVASANVHACAFLRS